MLTRLRLRGATEDGLATTAIVVTCAVVLVAAAIGLSLARKDDARTTSKAPRTSVEQRAAQARAEIQSGLKNAATAMEAWATENGGTYAGACPSGESSCEVTDSTSNGLVQNGLALSPDVRLVVVRGDATGYCLRATHVQLPPEDAAYYASEVGSVSSEPCI